MHHFGLDAESVTQSICERATGESRISRRDRNFADVIGLDERELLRFCRGVKVIEHRVVIVEQLAAVRKNIGAFGDRVH